MVSRNTEVIRADDVESTSTEVMRMQSEKESVKAVEDESDVMFAFNESYFESHYQRKSTGKF